MGFDYYAASGQNWLCGPIGIGYLFVRAERIEERSPVAAGYGTVSDPLEALQLPLRPGAARFDAGFPAAEASAWSLAALDVLEQDGIETVHARGAALAAGLAADLAEAGRAVSPRGRSTLVSWESPDNEAEAARLADQRMLVRHLPGTPYVRASVGAWSSEEELGRLVGLCASPSRS